MTIEPTFSFKTGYYVETNQITKITSSLLYGLSEEFKAKIAELVGKTKAVVVFDNTGQYHADHTLN